MSAGLAAALLAGCAATLAIRVPWVRRPPERSGRVEADRRSLLVRLRPALAGLSGVGVWVFVGGPVGLVVAIAAAVATWRVLGRAESPAARRRREELERELAPAVHLLGACLAAGSAITAALGAVEAALPGAVAEELSLIRHRLELGADPVAVWRAVADHPQLCPLGRAMVRAHRSGASVRASVDALASELAAQSRARTDALARSVEVRAAAPLGACFLPAFVLLGVVPMVVGVFAAMSLFG